MTSRRGSYLALVTLALVCLLLAIAWHRSSRLALTSDYASSLAAVREVVPAGTPIARVSDVMEHYGFVCMPMVEADFVEAWGPRESRRRLTDADFLYCSFERFSVRDFLSERWQVAFVSEDGTVADVFLSYGNTFI